MTNILIYFRRKGKIIGVNILKETYTRRNMENHKAITKPNSVIYMRLHDNDNGTPFSQSNTHDYLILNSQKNKTKDQGMKYIDFNSMGNNLYHTNTVSLMDENLLPSNTNLKNKENYSIIESNTEKNQCKYIAAINPANIYDRKMCIDKNFLFESLKNDKRIKSFTNKDNAVVIQFWQIKDSIEFYQQYYPYGEISFLGKFGSGIQDVKVYPHSGFKPHDDTYVPIYPCDKISVKLDFFDKIDYETNIEEVLEHSTDDTVNGISSEHLIFENRIIYFESLSKLFSTKDVKKYQCWLNLGVKDFIFDHTKELIVGRHTNVILQDAISLCTQKELIDLVDLIGDDIGPISATKHGAYVIQKLLSSAEDLLLQQKIIEYIGNKGYLLVQHPIGNYTIQKILNFNPRFVLDIFLSKWNDIMESDLAIKVFKRCLRYFSEFLTEIIEYNLGNNETIEKRLKKSIEELVFIDDTECNV
ncbi:Pumilio domain-containing protein C6G9.14 [Astathelohania contejeani]|uniref:Pumilio domain-containing protein C6G9.14 n=1 Tax=Astathelohania contejeani TaxID=164912 RepID=A0ABQ7HZ04_9MICR|nr:Pumilio domain-containing protein C6G9.14 [Thelohania contejeani]